MPLVAPLPAGPLDVVGDVHGEADALAALLKRLGYGPDGAHPEGRSLVFVGDLIDRGPDSPRVLAWVRDAIERGYAQCVLGNHELNVLRDERRHGNGWWFGVDEAIDARSGPFPSVRLTDEEERLDWADFLRTLPLALVRDDLRVVHACWSDDAVAALPPEGDAAQLYADSVSGMVRERASLAQEARRRRRELGERLAERRAGPPAFEPAIAAWDELRQRANPLALLTSGREQVRPDRTSFWSSGKWRFVERVKWWESYDGPPVVFGHYWRRARAEDGPPSHKGGMDLFRGVAPDAWLGPHRRAYCVDFSAGFRFRERSRGVDASFAGTLAALRVPEWQVVFDDGRPSFSLGPPGTAP